MKGAKHWPVLQ